MPLYCEKCGELISKEVEYVLQVFNTTNDSKLAFQSPYDWLSNEEDFSIEDINWKFSAVALNLSMNMFGNAKFLILENVAPKYYHKDCY
jgi:hypothetical protein